jgi:hypothetical protein
VSLVVVADVSAAFRVFTEEMDAWWLRGPGFRVAGDPQHGMLCIEPRLNGRLFESFDSQGVTRVVRTGRVVEWQPPTRLAFDWRGADYARDELTRVEVTFEAMPAEQTRVTVAHRGFAALRPDHPARRGATPDAFLRARAAFWQELLQSLREHT